MILEYAIPNFAEPVISSYIPFWNRQSLNVITKLSIDLVIIYSATTEKQESTVRNIPKDAVVLDELIRLLRSLIGHVEFGSIELIFHNGKLVQLEKSEKIRFDKP